MKKYLSMLAAAFLVSACSIPGAGPDGGTVYSEDKNVPSFRITSPKSGEVFCMGQDALIAWEGDSNIQTVTLELHTPGTYRMIGSFPLNFKDGKQQDNNEKGEYLWPAGKLAGTAPSLGEGYAFQMGAAVYYKKDNKRDGFSYVSDAVFSIVNCDE